METLDSSHREKAASDLESSCGSAPFSAKIPPNPPQTVGGFFCSQKSPRIEVHPSWGGWGGLASFLITFIIKECLLMFDMGIHVLPPSC